MDCENIFKAVCDSMHLQEVITAYSNTTFNGKKCRCMFHNDRTPSFSLYERDGKELWNCFGCNAGGDVINWVERFFNLKPLEAARKLNEDFGLGLKVGRHLSKADKQRLSEFERRRKIEAAWMSWQRQHELTEIDNVKNLEQQMKSTADIWAKAALQAEIDRLNYNLDTIDDRTENEWESLYLSENGIDQSEGDFMKIFAAAEGIADADKDGVEKGKTMVDEKEKFSIETLEKWLAAAGKKAEYNEISRRVDYSGFDNELDVLLPDTTAALIYSDIAGNYKFCNPTLISDYLKIIGGRNSYNPVLRLLGTYEWDGADRLEAFYNMLHIPVGDDLSRILLKKWMMQAVSLQHNSLKNPFGSDGFLVLQGDQGFGKSWLCEKLALRADLYGTSKKLDFRIKDTLIETTSTFITELGEGGRTFCSNNDELKAFITSPIDEFRVPFGRTSCRYPRHTSFIATVNDPDFITDVTGSRRFWVVPLSEQIDLNMMEKFDFIQLWKQVQDIVKNEGLQAFRLTPAEHKTLAERNGCFGRLLASELEVANILAKHPDENQYQYISVTEFIEAFDILKNYSPIVVGKALTKLGYPDIKRKIGGKVARVRLLPTAK